MEHFNARGAATVCDAILTNQLQAQMEQRSEPAGFQVRAAIPRAVAQTMDGVVLPPKSERKGTTDPAFGSVNPMVRASTVARFSSRRRNPYCGANRKK
ncbi:hypothetical protein MBLL_00766 (plasmid) [Methylobacterium bullatum]|uniref:Uncharacterized protein n=1 Tax=Methylobacterium bullatum TaxID=570505 RepID=A0A679JDA8_9HYPH|nr:hypothetical protein MBLL_00766 [Methylobacterium bullatum]